MTISTDLKTRYTTEVDVDWHSAFILSHPETETYYIIDHTEEFQGYIDGFLQTFYPVPTKVIMPTRDSSGRQDMSLVWCNIQTYAQNFLDSAIADASQPITCRYTVYIEGDTTPQIDPPIELYLTEVLLTKEGVSAVASRVDILNRVFPSEVYRIDTFPGLRRR